MNPLSSSRSVSSPADASLVRAVELNDEYALKEFLPYATKNGIACAMHTAAFWSCHFEMLKLLTENGASVNHDTMPPLTAAAYHGNMIAAKYLIELGADVNANHGSALFFAWLHGHADMIKYLREKGAKENTENTENTKKRKNKKRH